jgi:hypothetical protein
MRRPSGRDLCKLPSDPLSPEAAQYLLSIQFGQSDLDRMHQLAELSTAGMLTDERRVEFDSYFRMGNFLAVMQSKARRAPGRPIRDC